VSDQYGVRDAACPLSTRGGGGFRRSTGRAGSCGSAGRCNGEDGCGGGQSGGRSDLLVHEQLAELLCGERGEGCARRERAARAAPRKRARDDGDERQRLVHVRRREPRARDPVAERVGGGVECGDGVVLSRGRRVELECRDDGVPPAARRAAREGARRGGGAGARGAGRDWLSVSSASSST